MVTIVALMSWLQPTLIKIVEKIWDTRSTALWKLLVVIVQFTIVLIGTQLYSENDGYKRGYRPPWWWQQGTRVLRDAVRDASKNATGNWIERIAAPSSQTPKSHRLRARSCGGRRTALVPLLVLSVFAMQAKAISGERETVFDTDWANVGIDNRCSACISHDPNDFVPGTLRPSDCVVKGFGGTRITYVQVRTLEWSRENDRGVITTFKTPNSYYVPDGKVRLLNPQHWACTQTNSNNRATNGERTDAHQCILFWESGRHDQRTINLGRRDNVATFTLAPGFRNFEAFCCEAGLSDPTQDPIALPIGTISDDETENTDSDAESVLTAEDQEGDNASESNPLEAPTSHESDTDFTNTATLVDFQLNGPTSTPSEGEGTTSVTSATNVIVDEEGRQPGDLAELLQLHHQFGHISMRKLQEMARQGTIPKTIGKVSHPNMLSVPLF